VAACIRTPGTGRTRPQGVRTFGTNTVDLLALRDRLCAHGVMDVAMKATGVFWKPVYYV
jgi:hypothetical protein